MTWINPRDNKHVVLGSVIFDLERVRDTYYKSVTDLHVDDQ